MRKLFRGLFIGLILLLPLTGCQLEAEKGLGKVSVIASDGRYGQAMWSPDGERIVVIYTDKGTSQIAVLSKTGQHLEKVASAVSRNSPGWVGSNVSYLKLDRESDEGALMIHLEAGAQEIARLSGAFWASWATDGRSVILKRSIDNQLSLWRFDLQTQSLVEVLRAGTTQRVQVSPTGRYVAFTDARSSAVSVLDLQTQSVRELWRVPSPGNALAGLAWSPDERYLGVRRSGNKELDGFYLIDMTAASAPVRLTTEDMVDPDWSPDGTRILYTSVGVPGSNQLLLLTLPEDWREKVQAMQPVP